MAVIRSGQTTLGPSLAIAGQTSFGSIAIDGGSDVTVTPNLAISSGYNAVEIGVGPVSNGVITVDGTGSTLTSSGGAGNINVGRAGDGRLTITDGGAVNGFFIVVGRSASSNGLLQVDGPGSQLTASDAFGNFTTYTGYAGFLRAGRDFGSYGRIEVTNGGRIDVQNDPTSNYDVPVFSLGRNYGSTGVLLVDGPGSELNLFQTGPSDDAPVIGDMPTADNLYNGPYFSLGYRGGTGIATVQNGGRINIFGEDSALEIGQQNIGGAGENEMFVLSGGVVSISSTGNRVGALVSVGREAGTDGRLVIDGEGSRLEIVSDRLDGFEDNRTSELLIGERGQGALTLTNGARVTIDGANDAFPKFIIGEGVTDDRPSTANGTAMISGPDTELVLSGSAGSELGVGAAGLLAVGLASGSQGTLTIENGARVANTAAANGVTIVAGAPGTQGEIAVTGADSTLIAGDLLLVGGALNLETGGIDRNGGGDGALTIANGRIEADQTVIGTTGRLDADGLIDGNLSVAGTFDIAGTGTGLATIDGALQLLSGAAVALDVADWATVASDRLAIAGDADFALGASDIALRAPSVPEGLSAISIAIAEVGGFLVQGQSVIAEGDVRIALETRGDTLFLDAFRPTALGSAGDDALTGTAGDDIILALEGDDGITATLGSDTLHGGLGLDTVTYAAGFAQTNVLSNDDGTATITGSFGTDTLIGVERIAFDDGLLFLDSGSGALDFTFRLYQAALGRRAEAEGLAFWVSARERGLTERQLAEEFASSFEFQQLLGDGADDAAFIEALYLNTLGRPSDQPGFDFWFDLLSNDLIDEVDMLLSFSDSVENIARTAADTENGVFFAEPEIL